MVLQQGLPGNLQLSKRLLVHHSVQHVRRDEQCQQHQWQLLALSSGTSDQGEEEKQQEQSVMNMIMFCVTEVFCVYLFILKYLQYSWVTVLVIILPEEPSNVNSPQLVLLQILI